MIKSIDIFLLLLLFFNANIFPMMPKPLQNISVLAADDSPLNLMIITQVLTNAGATIVTAENGRQVLEKLEATKIDIILMDLQMPELDGFETAMVIRHCGQQYSNVPIIAVTAETDLSEIEKSKIAGMNDFISKPFAPQVIYEKILALIKTTIAHNTVTNNIAAEDLPNYDLTYLKEITNGDKKNMEIIVNNLIENAPVLLSQSINAIEAEEWIDASSYLHKLKGLVSLFFMPKITDSILMAEKEAKQLQPNKFDINKQISFISHQLPHIIQLISINFLN